MDPIGTKVNQRYTLQAGSVGAAWPRSIGLTTSSGSDAGHQALGRLREARGGPASLHDRGAVMVRLHHSNVVTVLDFDHLPVPFIAMGW